MGLPWKHFEHSNTMQANDWMKTFLIFSSCCWQLWGGGLRERETSGRCTTLWTYCWEGQCPDLHTRKASLKCFCICHSLAAASICQHCGAIWWMITYTKQAALTRRRLLAISLRCFCVCLSLPGAGISNTYSTCQKQELCTGWNTWTLFQRRCNSTYTRSLAFPRLIQRAIVRFRVKVFKCV